MKRTLSLIVILCVTGMAYSAAADHDDEHEVEEKNKQIVRDFYQEVFGDKNIDAADKYVSDKTYIQHNPLVADGLVAMKAAMKIWFKDATKEKINVQRIASDGDLVWIHLKGKAGTKMNSVIDIFKLKDGKIIEHWDVIQEVPETAVNSHPMF